MFQKAILGMVLSVAASAGANVCLQQASNQELVNELSRRLYVGGGGGGALGAQANYSCDLYGDMRVGLIGPTGEETKADVQVRNAQTCARQREVLAQFKSRIGSVSVIGVCDLYGDMQRFSLTGEGRIQKLSEIVIRNVETCLRQADILNKQ